MGTKLQFSSAYHPQTNGQTEVVNKSLETLLCCLVGKNLRAWDIVLSSAKFVYNNSVNRTTDMSLFEIVTGYKHGASIDLIHMFASQRPFESTFAFASDIPGYQA